MVTLTQKDEHFPRKKPAIVSIALIIIFGFLVYGNALNYGFIWDDQALIEENTYIKSWSSLPEIFTQDIGAGAELSWKFYRPLQMVSYMMDYSIWKLNPRGYHLTNILLHILGALSVYQLMNMLFKDHFLSTLTGALFIVHPIHTEAVTYISGRADPLALLFMLLCFILYIKPFPSKRIEMYLLMLLSFCLALLSKESSLILPVLLLLYHFSFKKKVYIKNFFSLAGIALIYIVLRIVTFEAMLTEVTNASTFWQRLPGVFAAMSSYARLLFIPVHLHMEYGHPLFHWSNPSVIFGLILLIALLFYAFRNKETHPPIFFSIIWFFVALLPVSNLYPINAYMAEHWLYLPSIGFFLAIAHGLHSLYKSQAFRPLAIFFIIGILAWHAFLTIKQNSYWQEPVSFYERTISYAPNSERVYNNLGIQYDAVNNKEKAIQVYQKAIDINPNYAEPHYNLGNIYSDMGKSAEAISAYKRALAIKPNYAGAYINMGSAYDAINRREEAISAYKKGIEIKPDSFEAYNNLGTVYEFMNKKQDAIAAFKKAISIKPDENTYFNLGVTYESINEKDEAIDAYKRAIEINPEYIRARDNLNKITHGSNRRDDDAQTYYNLGNTHQREGENVEAIAAYKKAIEINPDHAWAHNNLGAIYESIHKNDEAIAAYKRAIDINADHVSAHYNLGNVYFSVNKYEEAIIAWKKAIEIESDYKDAYNNLAVLYFQMKQYDLAIEYFDRAKELGLTNTVLLKALEPYR